jgi:3-dehydroquinate dehydratase II
MKSILFLNGPNLNLLGTREVEKYGTKSLVDIEMDLKSRYEKTDLHLSVFQSNHEGALIDEVHKHIGKIDGLMINPGGLSHTSVSLRDAVVCLSCPKVEVHITNIHSREPFRHVSYFSSIVDCVIAGAGTEGYVYALQYLMNAKS